MSRACKLDLFSRFSQPVISSIGIDTEQACRSTIMLVQSMSMHFRHYSIHCRIIARYCKDGLFCQMSVLIYTVTQLCTRETNRVGSPVISYTIEIMQNRQLCLRIPQGVVNWKTHPVLKELPAVIASPDDVKEIVETMNYSKHCQGINDEKFNLLLIKHNDKFFDCSGKLFAYM